MESNITYREFQEYLESGKAENVDMVTSFFALFIMSHAKALYKHSEYHLESNNMSEDAFQNVVIACLQDLALQTSGGAPKFEYRGKSESELLGYVKLRLGSSFENDKRRSTEHSKIRRKQRIHDNIDDHMHAESTDNRMDKYLDLDSAMSEAFHKIKKAEHKLGLSLNYGLHSLGESFNADNIALLAERLGGSKIFVSGVKTRTEYLINLTSELKLDAKQIAHIVGMTPGNFRRIDKAFRDGIQNT